MRDLTILSKKFKYFLKKQIFFIESFALHLLLILFLFADNFFYTKSVAPIGVKVAESIKEKVLKDSSSMEITLLHDNKYKVFLKKKDIIKISNAKKTLSNKKGPLGEEDGIKVSPTERYIYELRQYIENQKQYPSMALRLRQEGVVTIKLILLKNGKFKNIQISSPSAYSVLNTSTKQLFISLNFFKPFPKTILAKKLELLIPVKYKLK
ncbi:MAG: energy transducer TonB [Bdellovibrionales bacterium]|nr:energy transducer TonB [Bdellovibrionales bacterium]